MPSRSQQAQPPPPQQQQQKQPPLSFKTDVRRAPTKKWATASKVSYEGDDWGSDDDYNDLDAPPPLPKPTGFRQKGQIAGDIGGTGIPDDGVTRQRRANTHETRDEEEAAPPVGRPPTATVSSQVPTVPMPSPRSPQTAFGHDGTVEDRIRQLQQKSQQPPPQRAFQGQQFRPLQDRWPAAAGTPHTPASPDTAAMSNQEGSQPGVARPVDDYGLPPVQLQPKRDFSQPFAVPPPLHTRTSPILSHHREPSPSTAQHPPRKSSLSRHITPDTATAPELPELPGQDFTLPPDQQGSENQPTSRKFIRPADIYKRIEEEREKERRSSESSRPSSESLCNNKLPASMGGVSTRSSLDADGGERDLSVVEDQETSRRIKPTLAPVPERMSEQNFVGFAVDDPVLASAIGADVVQTQPKDGTPFFPFDASNLTAVPLMDGSADSQPPMLAPIKQTPAFELNTLTFAEAQTDEVAEQQRSTHSVEESQEDVSGHPYQLSTAPTSAVPQVFDQRADSPPPTLFSRDQAHGAVQPFSNTTTAVAAGVGPVITGSNAGEPIDQPVHPVEDYKEGQSTSWPTSAELPHATHAPPSDANQSDSLDISRAEMSSDFATGYNRNPRPPSNGISLARSSAVEPSNPIDVSRAAELSPIRLAAMDSGAPVSIINSDGSTYHTELESGLAAAVQTSPEGPVSGVSEAEYRARIASEEDRTNGAGGEESPKMASRITKEESPSKGRVRDLAGQFSPQPDARRASFRSTGSKGSASSWERSRENSPVKTESRSPTRRARIDTSMFEPPSQESSPAKSDSENLSRKNRIDVSTFESSNREPSPTKPGTWSPSRKTRAGTSTLESQSREQSPSKSESESLSRRNRIDISKFESPGGFPQRPLPKKEFSFRPVMPGGWMSYTTTSGQLTPAVAGGVEEERREGEIRTSGLGRARETPESPEKSRTPVNEGLEIAPTTKKRPLTGKDSPSSTDNPLSGLRAASSALAGSLLSSIGMGKDRIQDDTESGTELPVPLRWNGQAAYPEIFRVANPI